MAKKQGGLNLKNKAAGIMAPKSAFPTWGWLATGGVVAVLLVVGLLYLGNARNSMIQSDIEGAVIFPDPGRGHKDGDIAYQQDAPIGGIHNPEWLNCGIYDKPQRRENLIHSMEHGAVWIAYQPDLPIDQVDILRNFVRREQAGKQERWIVLAPQPGLDDPVVATAWQVQLRLENAGDPRLGQFVKEYVQGPYYPEPGASCTFGGIGQPIS